MTQDERWPANWKAVMDFMETNHCRPSKYNDANRDCCKKNESVWQFKDMKRRFEEGLSL